MVGRIEEKMRILNAFIRSQVRSRSIVTAFAMTMLVLLPPPNLSGVEVQFSASEYEVSETASVVTVKAVRDDAVGVAQVNVQVSGGSAQSPEHYYLKTWVISFPDGASSADLSVFIVDNSLPSSDHDVLLELVSDTEGLTIGTIGTTSILIVDNDAEGFPGLGVSGHSFGQFGSFAPRVNAFVPDGQGRWLAAGGFTSANGRARTNLVRVSADGSVDDTFNPDFTANLQIFAVVMAGDGKILIGGQFTEVNGSPAGGIARLLPDGSLDPDFTHGTGFGGGTVETLEVLVWHLRSGATSAGGYFE
jgi:hypothetical protein